MGREIRRVPANWQHPETEDNYGRMRLQPMHDSNFATAKSEWISGLIEWEAQSKSGAEGCEYWEYEGNPPDPQYYRPWQDDDATWFQVWETVSEGTPVSPPFATEEELIDYLAKHGDFWDQERCKEPDWARLWGGKPGVSAWGRDSAERFVKAAWAPSMIVTNGVAVDGKFAV